MSTDVFSNFGALEELIQVVYQSVYKFVALSNVVDDQWTVYLALANSGRWWKGTWSNANVHEILGENATDDSIEKFAENAAELFIGGEIYISNVNPSPAQDITFTIGPASKQPVKVELLEISAAEAAEFATTIFLDIALQAQSRKGRMHGSSVAYSTPAPASAVPGPRVTSSTSAAERPRLAEPSSSTIPGPALKSAISGTSNSARPENSKAKAKEDSVKSKAASKAPDPKKRAAPTQKVPVARPSKGASLVHPNKKARKYQAVEFGSDDDD